MQLILRPYQKSDIENLVKHANNFNISKYLTNKFPFPYEKKDGEAFIQLALSHDPLQIKAIVLNDEVIGSIGVHQLADIYSKSAEMGYWIGEEHWGKGIVALAIKEMLQYMVLKHLKSTEFSRGLPIPTWLHKGFYRNLVLFSKQN